MKTNLTIERVADILSKHELCANIITIQNLMNLQKFEECIDELLDNPEIDFSIYFKHPVNVVNFREFNFINDRYKTDLDFVDITVLSFQNLYGSIIVNLIKQDSIKFNIIGFSELFVFLYENRTQLKAISIDTQQPNIWNNCKFILNATYGLLISKSPKFLYSNMKMNLITLFVKNTILRSLNFTNCIAGDTDDFYFDMHNHIHRQVFELACDDFAELGLSFEVKKMTVNFTNRNKRFERWCRM